MANHGIFKERFNFIFEFSSPKNFFQLDFQRSFQSNICRLFVEESNPNLSINMCSLLIIFHINFSFSFEHNTNLKNNNDQMSKQITSCIQLFDKLNQKIYFQDIFIYIYIYQFALIRYVVS